MNLVNSFWVKAAWWTLLAYFFGLACAGKEFSYFHLRMGPLPLFVGECALLLALLFSWVHRKTIFNGIPKFFLFLLAAYLGWGLILLPISALRKSPDIEWVQVLRDSALYYQSAWVIFGLLLTPQRWKAWLTACLIGVGSAQYFMWFYHIYVGLVYRYSTSGFFGFIHGNESYSYMFPLALAIWPTQWIAVLVFTYGHAVLGLFLIYFKKSWIVSVVAIAIPSALWAAYQKYGLKLTLIRGGAFATSLAVGLLLAGYGAQVVAKNHYQTLHEQEEYKRYLIWLKHQCKKPPCAEFVPSDSGMDPSVLQMIRDRTKDLNSWFFHGELDDRSKETPFTQYIAWRTFLWKQTWKGFLNHPLLGNGYGPRAVTVQLNGLPTVWEGKWIAGPHNSFLTVAFRGGIIGILSLLLMILFPMLCWAKKMFTARGLRGVSPESYIGFAALVIMVFAATFNVILENPQGAIPFWVILGAFVRLVFTDSEPKIS